MRGAGESEIVVRNCAIIVLLMTTHVSETVSLHTFSGKEVRRYQQGLRLLFIPIPHSNDSDSLTSQTVHVLFEAGTLLNLASSAVSS